MRLWFIIVTLITIALTLYIGFRLIEPSPIQRKWKITGWLMMLILLVGHQLTRFVHPDSHDGLAIYAFHWAGYTFLGFLSFLVIPMLIRDIPILFYKILQKIKLLTGRRPQRTYFTSPNYKRRQFILNASNAAFLTAAFPLSAYSLFQAREMPRIVHNDLPIANLPEGLDGFTIAHISDTHIGPTIRGDWVQTIVNEINSFSPDMIVHTGDMVDGSVRELRTAFSSFSHLKAPYGVWMCTGNHEYYSGVESWIEEAKCVGMTPLINEHRIIDTGKGRLLLAGVTDYRSERIFPQHKTSPTQAFANAPAHDVSLLLAHQPQSIFEASQVGFDIQLSGHTHGGQFFPWTVVIDWVQPYVRGLHLHENTLLYVNVGTGYWGPPMRLGAKPEITIHTLRNHIG